MEPDILLTQLVTDVAAAHRLAVSRATFHRLVKAGKIPRGIKFGEKQQSARRWRLADILAFVESRAAAC